MTQVWVHNGLMSVAPGEVALVLVHGGGHDSRCWEPTVTAIQRRSDVSVVTVDLPGRGSRPGPLRGLTIAACVDAVVDQVRDAELGRVVMVGHSMAGMIVPGVAAVLGRDKVERCVLIAANVVADGGSVLDTLPLPMRLSGGLAARWPRPYRMPRVVARRMFCNGMSPEDTRFVTERLVPEAGWLAREKIRRPATDHPPPITWVLTKRDRAVSPGLQRRTIDMLDEVDDVVSIDAPHDVMVSHPEVLAEVLLARIPSH